MTVRQQILRFDAAPEAIGLDEALANARRAQTSTREFRGENPAHLPPESRLPDLYALCPGCQLHPGGGIYPAEELAANLSDLREAVADRRASCRERV